MRLLIVTALLVTLSAASPLLGQSRPAPFASLDLASGWQEAPSPDRPMLLKPERAEGKNHLLTGALIGAAVGVAAGYLFYNTICEAVDNQCSDSRVRLMVLGGATGGVFGAVIGSLLD